MTRSAEYEVCTAQIEAKTKQIGELGVDIVELKEDLTDTEAAYVEDKKYLADLQANCFPSLTSRAAPRHRAGDDHQQRNIRPPAPAGLASPTNDVVA